MPIATPEVYAQMLDRAKERGFAYPAINVTSEPDAERRAARVRRGGQRRHRPGLHRRRRVPVRPDGQGHGDRRRSRSPQFAHVVAGKYPVTSRCTPTTARRTSWTASCARCSRSPRSGWPAARSRCSSRTCGTARRCRWTRTSHIASELLDECAAGAHRSWRSRSAWSAARRTASSARSTRSSTPRPRTRWPPPRRSGSASRAATCSPPPSATCTASTSRATSSCARRS